MHAAPPISLKNATQAAQQAVFHTLAEQVQRYMGALPGTEQKRLLELTHRMMAQRFSGASITQEHERRFEQLQLPIFRERLMARLASDIDPKTTFLLTQYRAGESAEAHHKGDQLFQRKVSLWEAAKTSFDWRSGPQSINNDNTRVVDAAGNTLPGITTTAVTELIRELDVAAQRSASFNALASAVAATRQQAADSAWQLACLDFERRHPDGAKAAELQAAGQNRAWKSFSLSLDKDASHRQEGDPHRLQLPLLVFTHNQVVYSHFPGRPGGALAQHFSEAQAVSDFSEAIRADLGWLRGQLSSADQLKLQRYLGEKDPQVIPDQLNAVARFLYHHLHQAPISRPERLFVVSNQAPARPIALTRAIATLANNRFEANWNFGYRSTAEADAAALTALANEALADLLEMLSLPLSPIGLNRVMQANILLSLGYQVTQGGIALGSGDTAEAVQAWTDLIDLATSGLLQQAGHKLTQRRADALIRAMGSPQVRPQGNELVWKTDSLRMFLPPLAPALAGAANRHGAYRQDGKEFGKVLHDGQLQTLEITYDTSVSAYRVKGARTRGPALRYEGQHFVVDNSVEMRGATTTQLLSAMLATELNTPPLSAAELVILMKRAAVHRVDLERHWQDLTPLANSLVDVVAQYQFSKSLHAASTPGAHLTISNERVILPALAHVLKAQLQILNSDGSTYLAFTATTPSHPLVLVRADTGLYRSAAAPMTPPQSLWQAAVAEHARVTGSSDLGANALDNSPAGRQAQLQRWVADEIQAKATLLLQALTADRISAHFLADDPARRYAPTVDPSLVADADTLTLMRLYPHLSRNTARWLLLKHPPTAGIALRPARHRLPMHLRNACLAHSEAARLNTALASLAAPAGNGAWGDSEALLSTALTALDPLDIQIRIVNVAGAALATYGPSTAKHQARVVRKGVGDYCAIDAQGNETSPLQGANPLLSSVLLALPIAQRRLLGLENTDTGRLLERVVKFYGTPYTRNLGLNVLQRGAPSALVPAHIKEYLAKDISLAGLSADARGVYAHANGKLYIDILGAAYQVKEDSLYTIDDLPTLRLLKYRSPQARFPGNDYNSARGTGMAVQQSAAGVWLEANLGVLGGSPLKRTPMEIIQTVWNINEEKARAVLEEYDFPPADLTTGLYTSPHNPATFADYLYENDSLPAWSKQYRRPQLIAVFDDHEINPLANEFKHEVTLDFGESINRLGWVESTTSDVAYRAIANRNVERSGNPSLVGFRQSKNFDGIPKMIDGPAVIASLSIRGAKTFAESEFPDGYSLYRIDIYGLITAGLERNVEINERFTEQRLGYRAGTIAKARDTGDLNEIGEQAYSFREIHISNTRLGPERIHWIDPDESEVTDSSSSSDSDWA